MQGKRNLLSGLEPLLWGAALILLIAGLLMLRQDAQVAYPDAAYVWSEEGPVQ